MCKIDDRSRRRGGPKTVAAHAIDRWQPLGRVDLKRNHRLSPAADHGELNSGPIGAVEAMKRCRGLVAHHALVAESQQTEHQVVFMRCGSAADPINVGCSLEEWTSVDQAAVLPPCGAAIIDLSVRDQSMLYFGETFERAVHACAVGNQLAFPERTPPDRVCVGISATRSAEIPTQTARQRRQSLRWRGEVPVKSLMIASASALRSSVTKIRAIASRL